MPRLQPGAIRDAVIASLRKRGEAHVADIIVDVEATLGRSVSQSSVRSYLNLNEPEIFKRVGHGRYKLARP